MVLPYKPLFQEVLIFLLVKIVFAHKELYYNLEDFHFFVFKMRILKQKLIRTCSKKEMNPNSTDEKKTKVYHEQRGMILECKVNGHDLT